MKKDDDELPKCPNCDSTLLPERLGAGRFICGCCARIFLEKPSKA